MGKGFTHLDSSGRAVMVDVGGKPVTVREAKASGVVTVGPEVMELLVAGGVPKGDVLATARVAGIMAAKQVDSLIPLCHPIPLHSVSVEFDLDRVAGEVTIVASVKTEGITGVEMEAMTAVSVAALTIYDMCKSITKGIEIGPIRLEYKSGGKSGTWTRNR